MNPDTAAGDRLSADQSSQPSRPSLSSAKWHRRGPARAPRTLPRPSSSSNDWRRTRRQAAQVSRPPRNPLRRNCIANPPQRRCKAPKKWLARTPLRRSNGHARQMLPAMPANVPSSLTRQETCTVSNNRTYSVHGDSALAMTNADLSTLRPCRSDRRSRPTVRETSAKALAPAWCLAPVDLRAHRDRGFHRGR